MKHYRIIFILQLRSKLPVLQQHFQYRVPFLKMQLSVRPKKEKSVLQHFQKERSCRTSRSQHQKTEPQQTQSQKRVPPERLRSRSSPQNFPVRSPVSASSASTSFVFRPISPRFGYVKSIRPFENSASRSENYSFRTFSVFSGVFLENPSGHLVFINQSRKSLNFKSARPDGYK